MGRRKETTSKEMFALLDKEYQHEEYQDYKRLESLTESDPFKAIW